MSPLSAFEFAFDARISRSSWTGDIESGAGRIHGSVTTTGISSGNTEDLVRRISTLLECSGVSSSIPKVDSHRVIKGCVTEIIFAESGANILSCISVLEDCSITSSSRLSNSVRQLLALKVGSLILLARSTIDRCMKVAPHITCIDFVKLSEARGS